MPNYGEILAFLAANPPHLQAERELHASLLELLAKCLRAEQVTTGDETDEDIDPSDIDWVSVN